MLVWICGKPSPSNLVGLNLHTLPSKLQILSGHYFRFRYCCCCCVASVVSDSMWSHRRQPTRLPWTWDSPDKNAGVGCHFLLQIMKMKSESEVAQLCLTLRDPTDCSLPGSSVHGIFQARVLDWGAIAFSYMTLTTQRTSNLLVII